MLSILISSESRYPVNKEKIKAKAREVLEKFGVDDVEVSISIVGSRKIRDLNRRFRKIDEPTDVLSFPLETTRDENGVLPLGDIIISYPLAQKYARLDNLLVDEEVSKLVEHGLLHLLGFDHEEGRDFERSSLPK